MIPTRAKIAQHLFPVALCLVLIAYASLAWQQLRYGIEYDESANLNLVKNVADGVGYATTGLNYGWLVPFDPGASTGPALLIPGAFFWHISGGALWFVRLVPLLYFALYLGCLWLIFKPIAGRWAALIAVAAPLCLSVGKADISTVSLVPGRYVGEFTAVAFAVLMVLLITRRHPLLAGLAGSLAMLTKFNFALPVVAIVVVWQVGLWIRGEQAQGRALLKALAGLVIPLLLFEVFRLTQLGFGGYLPNVKAYVAWLGGQAGGESAPMLETLGRRRQR